MTGEIDLYLLEFKCRGGNSLGIERECVISHNLPRRRWYNFDFITDFH